MTKRKTDGNPCPDRRSSLFQVGEILDDPRVGAMCANHGRPVVADAVRAAQELFRAALREGANPPSLDDVVEQVRRLLADAEFQRLRPVVNATGIILHTGLGRAVLPQRAVDELAGLNRCCNLQIDLETGLRGKRNDMTERLLCRLTGAEAAMVVNNNAAATLLVLAALCRDREVVVSRGQLIEIGGSYRLPDCVTQSGAVLVEVGTTNKTHLRDYEQAIGPNTGALLRVNPSNYRVIGFSKEVSIAELAGLRGDRPILVIDDLGCGALLDLRRFGLPHEPTVPDSVAAGADLVLFSGDKMIGGPQAGIIVGRRELVQKIRKHPLTRMLRVGKMTDLVLEQTLRLFLDPQSLTDTHPTIRMIAESAESVETRAGCLLALVRGAAPALDVRVRPGESETGGGALPGTPIPTHVLCVRSAAHSPNEMNRLLRYNEPPVIARIEKDDVVLDVRTLLPGEDAIVAAALSRIAKVEDPS